MLYANCVGVLKQDIVILVCSFAPNPNIILELIVIYDSLAKTVLSLFD